MRKEAKTPAEEAQVEGEAFLGRKEGQGSKISQNISHHEIKSVSPLHFPPKASAPSIMTQLWILGLNPIIGAWSTSQE